MNTNTKNLEILKQFLDGKSYADLANEYGYYNYGSVYQLVVNTLRMLKDYSDYEIPQTGSTEHVREKKDIILKAIDAVVLPKINIVPRVHAYLLDRYGRDYPKRVEDIVADWDGIISEYFDTWNHKRERNNILGWFMAEGYQLDNFLDAEHKRILMQGISEMLKDKTSKQHECKIKVGDVEIDNGRLFVNVSFTSDKVTANRRIRIELIDL